MHVLHIFTRFHATDGIATHTVDLTEALSFAACEVSFLAGMIDSTEETKWKVARLENTCKSFQVDPRFVLQRRQEFILFRDAIAALREHVKREAPNVIPQCMVAALWPAREEALRLLRSLPPCIATVQQEPERSLYLSIGLPL